MSIIGYILFGVSIVLNGLLIWYALSAAKRFASIADDLRKLRDISGEYTDHLAMVYEMETFYGEPVLDNLLKHSKGVVREITDTWREYALDDEEYDKFKFEADATKTEEEAEEE